MTSQVSSRGQITIDRKVRAQLGVEPGMVAYQRVVNGHLEIVFLPALHRRSLFGVLHREGEPIGPVTSAEIAEAVREAVAEKYARLDEQGG
jgi:bifunctional DNA-binding transcriptional regulator/antitoxin component of YhaV-PrlF toxin-antitoxin module